MNERTLPPLPPASPQPANLPAPVISGRDREFLPAAIEILETPPPPLPVVTMLTICVFFAAALAWSFYGRLDVHAVAPGKIDTAGRAKVIQPLDPGKVAAIYVDNGQRVRAGDLLLELDPAEPAAEENAQRDGLNANLAEIARRRFAIATARAVLDGPARSNEANAGEVIVAQLAQAASDPEPRIVWTAALPEAMRLREASVLTADLDQLLGSLQSLDKQILQKDATRQRLDMSIAYQNKVIETLTQLVSTRQEAVNREVGSKVNLYDSTQQLERSQSSLASDQGELIETDAALKELASQKIMTLSQFVADNENKLADAERRADEAKQALAKADARLARTKLYSPTDGVAQQIAVTTVGQVVTTGQQLLVVAPTQGALQVEALVANLDIGFVKPGQSVAVKVDAFPFTRFGVLHGKVTRVASEAVEEQEAKRGLANAAASANTAAAPVSQAGQPQSFVFPVTIALDEQVMNISGEMIPLTSGMTVSVEIKTDSRRVIDYLLSPLAKVTSEAFKER
ncbi:HlyD family type I secretion periplasmic adaptor subunit [Mesorhizobium sp.]|uniref:HlyD family type I secretion periplasmic adaptor subunit n=1 Tax=Mesorhizobium sp. TaxID=1871066 RepID=UPI000FE2B265|nr:HlyD family type I secretion periplasmic adaptor subunit [Mesorhizobium sp.]RWH75824.1 MAG: HlyD family type I secretion periplasmic adaptor subunit [Mesorhizobium sp.]RWL28924.1 MAG: HlyD family type I secretion periplasmic adaptor subunit [Mesorhizobium sp.]RWL30869.1 MAG: HlyD family type I secretion periplasmic adaptor subunit [Mesorhizobium sp.]RWL37360.1 MAG: HlyD family type I secretion periplasmic adaptor subunit [Mesorhizobium sp.]RWL45393.1 MAG: HlyD family type I secretion peripl